MALIFAVGQYVIIRFIGRIGEQNTLNKKLRLTQIHKCISIILYVLIGILVLLILQMALTSTYSLLLVEFAVCVNYLLGLALLGFLSARFLLWFKSNHKSIVLAYFLAVVAISINAVFTVLYVTDQLIDIYQSRHTDIQPVMAFVGNFNKLYDMIWYWYNITYVISFILTWVYGIVSQKLL